MDNRIKKATNDRTLLIEGIIGIIEKKLGAAQDELFRLVISDLVDKMDRDGDKIKNTLRNKRLVALVDNVFTDFARGKGSEVAVSVIKGVSQIMDFNGQYYGVFNQKADLVPIQESVKETLSDWLGITEKGVISKNGYLDTLINDPRVKNQIKDLTIKTVVNQAGYNETKATVRDFITGGGEDTGALKKYFRNYVYDTFSIVDRTASKITADKLQLKYAIYEGGLIETSRKFCREHNGKVYSRAEIAEFDPKEAKPPGYNPFTDLGGYGCRHHWNWVPDAVAFAMRPELKGMDPEPTEKPAVVEVPKETPKQEQKTAANVPFDDVKPLERREFKIVSKKFDQDTKELERHGAKSEDLQRQRSEALAEYHKNGKSYQMKAGRASTEEREQLLKELQDYYQKFLDKVEQLKTHEAGAVEIKQRLNKEIKDVLLKDKPKNNFDVSIKSQTLAKDKRFMQRVPEAVEFFRVASAKWLQEDLKMNMNAAKSRAFYSRGEVYLSKNDAAKTIVHEFAHHLESHNQVFKEAVDFLQKRTEGKPLRKLKELNKAYRPDEVFKDGGFPNEYDGKIYKGTRYKGTSYTEIVSRGLEYMFEDPAIFLRKDKDYFNFIYTLFF